MIDPVHTARSSRGDQVFLGLRRSILRGETPPGARLIEEKTAEEHGSSRTPVREALFRLEREGLIERRPRGGFVVRRMDLAEMEEIMELRAVLEGLAAARAARVAEAGLVEELSQVLAEYEGALKRREMDKLVALNTEFHDRFYRSAPSRRLLSQIMELRDYFYRFRPAILGLEGLAERSHFDHRQIIQAIARRDETKAEELAREHIHRSRLALREEVLAGRLVL